MDELIARFNQSRLAEAQACRALDEQILALTRERTDLARPYQIEREELLAELTPQALAFGRSYRCPGGAVEYRKGATRVTYDWRAVDAVQRALVSLLPGLAEQLAEARSESHGQPSITVKPEAA